LIKASWRQEAFIFTAKSYDYTKITAIKATQKKVVQVTAFFEAAHEKRTKTPTTF
jgi:hypothetical protein